jgi:alkylation response protein AidB-like acyl-CoA dehydrogenase
MSMFLVDMRAPGVEVVRRPTMNGWTLDDVVFHDVVLGPTALLGTLDGGWRQLASAVTSERSGTSWLGFARHTFDLLVDHVRSASRDGAPLADDPIARDTLARLAVDLAAAERLSRLTLSTLLGVDPAGMQPNLPQERAVIPLTAMAKVVATELLQELAQAATELAGHAGLAWAPPFAPPDSVPPGAAAGGRFAWEYLERVHGTISVGANELQRDVIAQAGLGLPRPGSPGPVLAPDVGAYTPTSGAGSMAALVAEARELGRAATPSTFHTDVLADLLGWSGSGRVAVALDSTATARGGTVSGVADFVAGAQEAERVLVVVGDDRVVEVDARGAGVSVEAQATIGDDGRGRVTFERAPVLAERDCDVEAAVARAAIVLAADAVGAAEAALAAAVAHVKARTQWGAPLGALQAVQHRAADMLIDVILAADAVLDAANIVDRAGSDGTTEGDVRLAAAYAKAAAIERCRRVTAAAHQLAGGQGILADRPFHRWYRRVKAAEPDLGDARRHRETVAAALLDEDG